MSLPLDVLDQVLAEMEKNDHPKNYTVTAYNDEDGNMVVDMTVKLYQIPVPTGPRYFIRPSGETASDQPARVT